MILCLSPDKFFAGNRRFKLRVLIEAFCRAFSSPGSVNRIGVCILLMESRVGIRLGLQLWVGYSPFGRINWTEWFRRGSVFKIFSKKKLSGLGSRNKDSLLL